MHIFILSGELVADSGELSGEETWIWNVKNREERKLARGIYIYLVTNNQGEKKIGKIAVIR